MEARHFTAAGHVPQIASAGKVTATVFWDSESVLMIDYLERGKPVKGVYYADQIRKPHAGINNKKAVLSQR